MTIHVRYQTPTLPPPYSYAYTLRAELLPQRVAIQLDWQYTDRDELSEEEIGEEGFSMDDDFRWQGDLPGVWKPVLRELVAQTRWLPAAASAEGSDTLVVAVTEAPGGVPDDVARWEYLLQELVQAVYEASGRERPLQIRYREQGPPSPSVAVTIELRFCHRRATATVKQNSQNHTQELSWQEMRTLLETLYLPDYHTERSQAKPPQQPGRFVDPGDGRWYLLGTAVSNPGKSDIVETLRQMLIRIVRLE